MRRLAVSAEDTLTLDPDGVGFHDILWGGLFGGAIGTGMSWWWDGLVNPQGYYGELAPIASLCARLALDREGIAPVAVTPVAATAAAEVGAGLARAHGRAGVGQARGRPSGTA